MNIKPLHDRIIVRERKSTMSDGGIYTGILVDDGLVKEMVEGEVLAVGPGLKLRAGKRDTMWDLKPGDIVKFSPVCCVSQGDGVVIIRRDAIAGVVV